ncbi:aromatic ring-hydroxylating oxygenase subunit alpha [Mycolicibacterium holsaticum]|nr:SRPBCC family protein [Mycolicibacterium holsaticum]
MMRPETELDLLRRLRQLVLDKTTTYLDDLWLVPVDHYTDAERGQRELTELLRREPVLAARSSDLASPGSYLAVTLLGVRLLLVRQPDGSVRAMGNACRHRGAQLVEDGGCGVANTFVCPYHGWRYGQDGRLSRVPHHFDSFVPMEKRMWGLVDYPVAERHGFIWAVPSPGGQMPDLGERLGALDAEFDAHRLAEWRLVRHETFDEAMNWKVVADGILDPYHPEFVHPETVGRYINNNVYVFDTFSAAAARLVMSKRSIVSADLDTVADNPSKYLFPNYLLLPNTFLVFQSRHFEVWTIEPHPSGDPQRSLTHIRILTGPDMFASEEEHDSYVEENWQRFLQVGYTEDWGVARRVQKGVDNHSFTDTIVGRNEAPLHFFHTYIGDRLGDGQSGLRPLGDGPAPSDMTADAVDARSASTRTATP